jgi:RNA polymerase sigma-70 factor (ECF subfamily)
VRAASASDAEMTPPSLDRALDAIDERGAEAPSLDALVALHGERALRIAARFVRGDRAAAEDVAQEAFARAWRALPRFRGEAELSTWLYRVVVNQALSHLRRQKLRDRLLALFGPERPAAAPPAPDPALRARIHGALDALSANERAVFTLVHLEGFSVEETARIRGRAIGTVKSHLHRALAKLRRELADCWEERP